MIREGHADTYGLTTYWREVDFLITPTACHGGLPCFQLLLYFMLIPLILFLSLQ